MSDAKRFLSAVMIYIAGNLLRGILPLSRHPLGAYLFLVVLYALTGLVLGSGCAGRKESRFWLWAGVGMLLVLLVPHGSLPAPVPGIGLSCHKPRGDPPRAAAGGLRVPPPPLAAEIITTSAVHQGPGGTFPPGPVWIPGERFEGILFSLYNNFPRFPPIFPDRLFPPPLLE